MSQVIREAVDLLRTVVDKLDARLRELDDERALLLETRAELLSVIGDRTAASSSDVRHAVSPLAPTAEPDAPSAAQLPAAPEPALLRSRDHLLGTGIRDAAARMEQALRHAPDGRLRRPDLMRASKLSPYRASQLIAQLVQGGRLARTGHTNGCRYALPSGRPQAAAAPGDTEGDRGAPGRARPAHR